MFSANIFVIFTSILCIEGLDINLKYCKFKCGDSCEIPKDKSNPIGIVKPPESYYWRDFYGIAPIDAFPLGPPTQFPQTFIGLAYDPSMNGTFVTTIYNGLDHVYTVLKNKTVKIDKHIQILCTKHPEQLSWQKITKETLNIITKTYQLMRDSYHSEIVNDKLKNFNHYIVKTDKCHFPYAGGVSTLDDKLEYSLIDGSSDATDQYLWLAYEKEQPKSSESSPSKMSFSANSGAEVNVDSNSAKFSIKITIGSCSASCSNEANIPLDSTKKMENDLKLSASMAYYWQPGPVIDKEEALLGGEDYLGSIYIGQAYLPTNIFDVGTSDFKSASINEGYVTGVESQYYQVLSTDNPDAFNWVNTTAKDFSKQDKNKMIPGGARDNGSETFVCREVDKALLLPGSARTLETGTYCYSAYGPVEEFQVLMIDPNVINPKSIVDAGIINERPLMNGTNIKLTGF